MKNKIRFNWLFVFLFVSGFSSLAQNNNSTEDIALVMTALSKQEKAWNAGDLNEFMKGYWENDSLVFVGRNGPKYGYANTALNYQKSYPNKASMGTLHFTILHVNQWDTRTIQLIGKYTLSRINDEPTGFFTLLYRKISGEWKIVSDHSSANSE